MTPDHQNPTRLPPDLRDAIGDFWTIRYEGVEYKQRIEDLEAELEEATRWGDVGRAARTREEIEFLKDELSSAFGLGGRARKAGSAAERARKAVASRMQDTIAKIRKEHPVLALHLENAIRTGVFCSYQPDRSPEWSF